MNTILQGLLANFRVDHGLFDLGDSALFEAFAAYCVVGQFHKANFEPDEMRTGGAHDLSIDAAAVIINGELFTDADAVEKAVAGEHDLRVHFVVIQAKLNARFQASVFTDMADGLYDIFQSGPMRLQANDRIKNFRRIVELVFADIRRLSPLPRLSVWYSFTGTAPPGPIPRQAIGHDRLHALNRLGELKLGTLGVKELAELFTKASAIEAVLPMPERIAIPTLVGVGKAFFGLVKARDLVECLLSDGVGAVRAVLFHQNVRHFQGYGRAAVDEPAVNDQIRDTLRDGGLRAGFAILNNGITIVAREVRPVGHLVHLVDIQIVNGCQTSYVLHDELTNLSNDVAVPVKVIETSDEAIVSQIVRAANSQNQFRVADLVARETFQKELELFFSSQPMARRLYYERRAMQYDGLSIEKTRIITRGHLTKAYASMFLDEAHRVSRLREVELSRGDDLFRDADNPIAYYVAASVYYRIDYLLRNQKLPALYRPARFHFIAGMKVAVLGPDRLPTTKGAYRTACEQLLECAWDATRSEAVANDIAKVVLAAFEAEGPGARWNDAVRTSRFRLAVVNGLVGLSRP